MIETDAATEVDFAAPKPGAGLAIPRVFAPEGVEPLDAVEWARFDAVIGNPDGTEVFRQDGVEFPASYDQQSVNVIASKYFHGDIDRPGERESSLRSVIDRISSTIAWWGRADGYFATNEEAETFRRELEALQVGQYGAFNSPVWFNVGVAQHLGRRGPAEGWVWGAEERCPVPCEDAYASPQASACFIQRVEDDLGSIMDVAKAEAMLFKHGSGTGSSLSTLRSTREKLSGGGKPSGPVSFFSMYDAVAKVIKSGGKTRRAARMQTLDDWHPDIREFVRCKVGEEAKAKALIDAGFDPSWDSVDGVYASLRYQNTNISPRLSDEFMRSAEAGGIWQTRRVLDGRYEGMPSFPASDLLDEIASASHACGDPGVQFSTTINDWHTTPSAGAIESSNPCSEFVYLDDSACNLASLNLMKFRRGDGGFDPRRFFEAVRIFIVAQDILAGRASYPTEAICQNSIRFRPLGIGYANLGAFLMVSGIPYDSDGARELCGAITSTLTASAYLTSATMARVLGPFEGFVDDRPAMLRVIEMHRREAFILASTTPEHAGEIATFAAKLWRALEESGAEHGFRNAQVSLLAPTGTIGFAMGCDTFGIEPDLALVKNKALAGGGSMKIVNRIVAPALRNLGYGVVRAVGPNGDRHDEDQVEIILDHIDRSGAIEGAPYLKAEHLPIFDCAFAARPGGRSISPGGHLKMMAAAQPFLSGAISKTVNLPADSTPADFRAAIVQAWKLRLKAVAFYRDESKGSQPLTAAGSKDDPVAIVAPADAGPRPIRCRLPDTRRSVTHKFEVGGHEGYITVGLYADGRPGEVFVKMAKEGSTLAGLMDGFATTLSMALQYGVPIEALVAKFTGSRFEPYGQTRNPDIPFASSLMDYIARWLGNGFVEGFRQAHSPARDESSSLPVPITPPLVASTKPRVDGVVCNCGSLMVRRGTCFTCDNCGSTSGCS